MCATGGTKISGNSPDCLHFVFQSQFRPHPPAMINGILFVKFASAKRKNMSNILSLKIPAKLRNSGSSTPTLK